MPWSETSPMDERFQFVADVRRAHETMTALCDRYGINRKTGDKVVRALCPRGARRSARALTPPAHLPHGDARPWSLRSSRSARATRPGAARSSSPCSRAGSPRCPRSRPAPRPARPTHLLTNPFEAYASRRAA